VFRTAGRSLSMCPPGAIRGADLMDRPEQAVMRTLAEKN
jgi:hypothetical protein